MKRREFILLGGAAGAWPSPRARSSPPGCADRLRIWDRQRRRPRAFVEALQQGMRERGYVDGKDFIIEYRGAEGGHPRFSELVASCCSERRSSSSHLFRLQSAVANRRPIRFRLSW